MAPKKRRAAASTPIPSKRTKAEQTDIIVISSDADTNVKNEMDKEEEENCKPTKVIAPTFHIPVDDYCGLSASYQVYIDDEGVVFDITLNQTNSSNNNNKFYRLQMLKNADDFRTWTRWGRIGEKGSNSTLGDGSHKNAFDQFKKKFRDKTGLVWDQRFDPPKAGKYVMLERNYEADDSQDLNDDAVANHDDNGDQEETPMLESKLTKPVQRLMELIFNSKYMQEAMQALDYDTKKMPLGKLSKRTISQAYQALKDLSEVLIKPDVGIQRQAIEDLSNLYLSLIPHDFGRRRPPTIADLVMLKKELTLLDSLSDMKVADEIMRNVKESGVNDIHVLDRQFQSLSLTEMTPLEEKSTEFKELKDYLIGTCATTHYIQYGKVEIFRLERDGEFERFKTSPFAKIKDSDKRLLWHGSRATNFGGILSTGLRIAPPEAPVNGYMFSKGLYLADMSTKSANYCMAHNSGHEGLLLLCEAELGDPMLELVQHDYAADVTAKQQGAITTLGKGSTAPRQWKDAACVHPSLKGTRMPDIAVKPTMEPVPNGSLLYNEYIAYDVAQVRLRYLFRVEMK